jgi:hypothetical protein
MRAGFRLCSRASCLLIAARCASPLTNLKVCKYVQPTNSLQDYVDFSSFLQPRFPRYFTADSKVSKDLNVGPKHAIRLSVSGIDLTNHLNPLQAHSNIADPQYGTFFGNYGGTSCSTLTYYFETAITSQGPPRRRNSREVSPPLR